MTVFLIITVLGLYEYYELIDTERHTLPRTLGIIAGSVLFVSSALVANGMLLPVYLLVNLPLFLLFYIIVSRSEKGKSRNSVKAIMGIFHIAIPFSMLNFFYNLGNKFLQYEWAGLLSFFILIWVYDVAAYIVGSLIGKHKLFERISPGKTWEGAIGGAVLCVIASYFLSMIFTDFKPLNLIIIALLIVIFGTIGDLYESMLKRKALVKDSGRILPGHGGVLDRFDAVLFAAPVVFIYLLIISA
jgi:phosphatidate cytidylyltransferase